jgi:hypothetical protein
MSGVPVIVSDVVTSLASQTVTRRRYTPGAISSTAGSKGIFTAGTSTDTVIAAAMQPLTGRMRAMLPEGIRLTARYLMHTLADVQGDQPSPSGSTTITQSDQIIYAGRVYQIWEDRQWVDHGQYRRFVLYSSTVEP